MTNICSDSLEGGGSDLTVLKKGVTMSSSDLKQMM